MKLRQKWERRLSRGAFARLAQAVYLCAVAAIGAPQAPLIRGLGEHHHPISTDSKLAQRYFDQGLVLMYGFNHAEAIRSFQAAAALDERCAMAWWGVSYAEGPNINAPMSREAHARARAALAKALALSQHGTPREQAYIQALRSRYGPEYHAERSAQDRDFANAMRRLANRFPDDLDAQTLFCEALMDTTPWNYWAADKTPLPVTIELLDTLQRVLRRDPHHPGANHFFIHAVEAGPTPEQGLPSADRMGAIAPSAGHLVHMASHIYVRVGQYDDAARANEDAVRADERYFYQCASQGLYPLGYYPHNIHFLWYANSLRANSREAILAAKKVSELALDARCGAVEGPRLRYLSILALAQFGKWDAVLAQKRPSDEYPFDQGMDAFARGVAYAAKGELDAAQAEYDTVRSDSTKDAARSVTSDYFPADRVAGIAEAILRGKLAVARGETVDGLKALRNAVAIEDEIAYMEPPFWHYSTRLSLGAALLKAGRLEEAEKTFREDLEWLPRNPWALSGLFATLLQSGQAEAARAVATELDGATKNADVQIDLSWF